jgi:hypothetical protein
MPLAGLAEFQFMVKMNSSPTILEKKGPQAAPFY